VYPAVLRELFEAAIGRPRLRSKGFSDDVFCIGEGERLLSVVSAQVASW
jgi:hypothetical protein